MTVTGLSADGKAIVQAVNEVSRGVREVTTAHKQSYRYLNGKVNAQNREIRALKKRVESTEKRLADLEDGSDC